MIGSVEAGTDRQAITDVNISGVYVSFVSALQGQGGDLHVQVPNVKVKVTLGKLIKNHLEKIAPYASKKNKGNALKGTKIEFNKVYKVVVQPQVKSLRKTTCQGVDRLVRFIQGPAVECSAVYTESDSGGGVDGYYVNYESEEKVLQCPGGVVEGTFTQFETEVEYDYVELLDNNGDTFFRCSGNDGDSYCPLGFWPALGTKIRSAESMTLRFNADYSVVYPGYTFEWNCCLSVTCGDGIVDEDLEECDDGNTDNNDGCSNSCRLNTIECPAIAKQSVANNGGSAGIRLCNYGYYFTDYARTDGYNFWGCADGCPGGQYLSDQGCGCACALLPEGCSYTLGSNGDAPILGGEAPATFNANSNTTNAAPTKPASFNTISTTTNAAPTTLDLNP
jgi:cysteine-rich repeat protein